MDKKSRNEKRKVKVLTIDLPADMADEVDTLLASHPFSRSRFGLLALELALPELRRRYPVEPPKTP